MTALAIIFGVLILVALGMLPYAIIKGKKNKKNYEVPTIVVPTKPTEPETPSTESGSTEPETPTVEVKRIDHIKFVNYFTATEQRSGDIAHIAITFADGHSEAWEWSAGQFGAIALDGVLETPIEIKVGDTIPINDVTIDMWSTEKTEWCPTYDGLLVLSLGSSTGRYNINNGGEVIRTDTVYNEATDGELVLSFYNE